MLRISNLLGFIKIIRQEFWTPFGLSILVISLLSYFSILNTDWLLRSDWFVIIGSLLGYSSVINWLSLSQNERPRIYVEQLAPYVFFSSLGALLFITDWRLYAVAFASGFLALYFNRLPKNPMPYTPGKKESLSFLYYLSLIGICCLFLFFGTYHLGKFMSVDEPKWLDIRVPQLYQAIETHDWAATYINDKPGILPAALAGTVNFFLDRNDFGPENLENYLFWWRFPIVFFNFLMLPLIWYLLKKLFDKKVALLAIGLIALNPILIGIGQIVNPDATLWSTALISVLSFFLYLKTNKSRYIYLSGLFLGLALLSKYFASIFFVLFFLIIYIEYLYGLTTKGQLCRRAIDVALISIISIGIYALLFPATWVNPSQILIGTIGSPILAPGIKPILIGMILVFIEIFFIKGKITTWLRDKDITTKYLSIVLSVAFCLFNTLLLLNILLHYQFFNPDNFLLGAFAKGQQQLSGDFFTSGYTILLTQTLPLLIGANLFFILAIFKKVEIRENLFVTSVFVLTTIFLVGGTLGNFVVDARYQIVLYPLYCILAAIFFILITKKYFIVLTTALLGISFVILWNVLPFPYLYTNILNFQHSTITEAWGFGGYEVAQQLNRLPNATELVIWSDREGVNEFFVGKTYWRGSDNPFEHHDIDYFVLSRGGQIIFRNTGSGRYYQIGITLKDYYTKGPSISFCPASKTDCIKVIDTESD